MNKVSGADSGNSISSVDSNGPGRFHSEGKRELANLRLGLQLRSLPRDRSVKAIAWILAPLLKSM